jgi:hypothetical protein
MNNVETQARQIVACGGPLEGASIAVLKRVVQLEKKDRIPRTGLIREIERQIRRLEAQAARAPKDAA